MPTNTANAAVTDADAQAVQLLSHARPAAAAQAQAALVAETGQEHHVAPLAMRRGPGHPGRQSLPQGAHMAAQVSAGQSAAIVANMLTLKGLDPGRTLPLPLEPLWFCRGNSPLDCAIFPRMRFSLQSCSCFQKRSASCAGTLEPLEKVRTHVPSVECPTLRSDAT